MKKATLLIVLASMTAACLSEAEPPEYSRQLSEREIFKLALDSITPVDNTYFTYEVIHDTAFIFTTNSVYNSIDIYLRKGGQFYKRIKFDREGPEGIAQIQGYTVVNPDSIFLFGKYHIIHTKLINWEGQFINLCPIPLSKARLSEFPIINHLSASGGFTYFLNQALYFTTFPIYNTADLSNYSRKTVFEFCYDFARDTLLTMPFAFPESYWGKKQPTFTSNPYRDKSIATKFIYSWPKEPYLVEYDYSLDIINHYPAHDTRLDPLISSRRIGALTEEENLKLAAEHTLYIRIIYDPYRQVYYRIALLPIKFNRYQHQSYTMNFERPLAILVLDVNFKPIALRFLEPNLYNPYSVFVGPDGLYIAKNNPKRANLNEDELEFIIFELR